MTRASANSPLAIKACCTRRLAKLACATESDLRMASIAFLSPCFGMAPQQLKSNIIPGG
jgi:hypothetical protein